MSIGYSEITSTISLITSTYLAYRTHKRDALQIKKDKNETEKKNKADLTARIYSVGKSSHRMKIANIGIASAYNINIDVLEGGEIMSSHDLESKFPYPKLDQHQSLDLILSIWIGAPNRVHMRLTWSDAFSESNEKELHVSVT